MSGTAGEGGAAGARAGGTAPREGPAGLPLPRLHLVTDDDVLVSDWWLNAARAVLDVAGPRVALHVRGPGLEGRVVYELVDALAGPAREVGAVLIVNDRVDVALALPVSGVQLRESSLPVASVRALVGSSRWVGASVHDAESARAAERDGADYLLVGTLFATPSHPGRAGGGTSLLAEVLAASDLPVVGIGGVTPDRTRALRRAGAHGVAVLRGVWRSPDAASAVLEYLTALES